MNKQCTKCGSVIVDGLNFCPSCGAPIEAPASVENLNPTNPVVDPMVVPVPTMEPIAPVAPVEPVVPVIEPTVDPMVAPVVDTPVVPVAPEVPVMQTPAEPVTPVSVEQDIMGLPSMQPAPSVNLDAAPGTGVTVDALLSTNAELEAKKEAMGTPSSNEGTSYSTGTPMLTTRGIAKMLIFSILTCGIYAIYWFIKLTEDANTVSGEVKPTGGMAFLLSLVTCGIYTYIWMYKQGEKIHKGAANAGITLPNRSVLYIIITLCGFGIVNYCLMQSDLNKIATK